MHAIPVAELIARVDAETRAIRAGRRAVGPWRIDPSMNVIRHARVAWFEIDLDAVTRANAINVIARAASKSPRFISNADLGSLVRLLDRLGLVSH